MLKFKKFNLDEDIDKLYNLILALDDYFEDYKLTKPSKEEVLGEFIFDLPPGVNEKQFFLIYKNDNLIGFIDYLYNYPKNYKLMIGYIVLLKEFRGIGYGNECLDFIKSNGLLNGMNELMLNVVENSIAAKVWKNLGFEIISEFDGEYGKELTMKRKI